MYSFLLDSEFGYNLDSAPNKDFYAGASSYLYDLLKHSYPNTIRTTIDKIQGKAIYEIRTCQSYKWNLDDEDKKIFDTIHAIQPTLFDMMKKQKALLHIDLSWEGNPLINQYAVWHDQIKKHAIPISSVVVSTSNLKEQDTYNQWCKSNLITEKIKIITFPYYAHRTKFGVKFNSDLTYQNHLNYKSTQPMKSFLSYNNKMQSRRIAFAAMLNYNNLIDDCLVSINSFETLRDNDLWWRIPVDQHPAYDQQNINMLKQKLPLVLDTPTFTNADDVPESWQLSQTVSHYLQTWFHVVVETIIFDSRQTHPFASTPIEYNFVTEKTFKPIKAFQPFVIFSMPGALQDLKQLGFRTFDQFWSEDYDNILDVQQRLKAVVDVIKTLSNLPSDTWLQMYKDMQPILEHNHHVLMHTEWIPTLEDVLG